MTQGSTDAIQTSFVRHDKDSTVLFPTPSPHPRVDSSLTESHKLGGDRIDQSLRVWSRTSLPDAPLSYTVVHTVPQNKTETKRSTGR